MGPSKDPGGSRLPTYSVGAACISIRRMVAGLPVERTKRWALRGTEVSTRRPCQPPLTPRPEIPPAMILPPFPCGRIVLDEKWSVVSSSRSAGRVGR